LTPTGEGAPSKVEGVGGVCRSHSKGAFLWQVWTASAVWLPLEKGAGGIVMLSITKLNWVPIVELALFRLFGVLWKHTAGILHQVHHVQ